MSSHSHSTDSHQHYYEGDQSKLYSGILAHHTDIESPESKSQIKKIWKVFWILLVITLVEVAIGIESLFAKSIDHLYILKFNIA